MNPSGGLADKVSRENELASAPELLPIYHISSQSGPLPIYLINKAYN